MPTFKVTDPSTGRTIRLTGDSPPTEQELEEVFKTVSAQAAPAPANPIQQADSQLNQAVKQSSQIAAATAAARAGGGGFISPPTGTKETQAEAMAGYARYGVPTVAGAATGGLGPAAMAGYGALGGLIGETVAEVLERFSGSRQEMDPKEIAATTLQSAVPVVSGGGIARGIGNVAMQAGGGMAAEAIRTEGENFASGALIPGGVSALTQTVGGVARGLGGIASRAAARSETLEKIGAKPTFGQAMPSMAAMEARVSSRVGGQELRQTLEQQGTDIADTVRSLTGLEPQGADVLTRRLLEDLGAEEAQAVANASSGLADARSILERVRGTAQEQTAARAVQDATQAYEQVIQITLFKGGKPDAFRIVKAGRTIEGLVDDARSAFKTKANELYAPIEPYANAEGFDLALRVGTGPSVTMEAGRILSEYPQLRSGGANPAFAGLANDIQALQDTRNPLSLNQLRQMREKLYAYADTAGEAFGTKAQRDIRNLAGTISNSIDDQAARVFGTAANNAKQGKVIADQLKEANRFYRRFRQRFDEYGVAQAFKPETQRTGQMGATVGSEVQRQGIDAPAFDNLTSLLDDLGKSGAKGVPASSDVATVIRSALVEPSVNVNTGDIDFTKLAETLNTVERQSPGALAKLGFGSKTQLDRFVKLTEELKDKPGPEKLIALLDSKSPTGIAVASDAIASLPDLKDIGSVVAKLEKLAATNPKAREGLQSLRATEIERLLVDISVNGRGARLSALKDFADSTKIEEYRTILGDNLFNRIKDDFLPGYKQLLEYRQAAGPAAPNVRGSAQEQLVTGAGQAVASTAEGKPGAGFWGIVADLSNLAMYKTAAGLMARAGGSTGYKSRADFMRTLDDVSRRIGSSANISAIQKYIDSGELPEEK